MKERIIYEIKEWILSFIIVAFIYFILLPVLLGTSIPLMVVASCSEKGYLNIGDVIVLQGTDIQNVNAPTVRINDPMEIKPYFAGKNVTGIVVGNQTILANPKNDIVVYSSPKGIIIHRALAKIVYKNQTYLLTKGDANPVPDQYSNYGMFCITENQGCLSKAVTQGNLIGRMILFPIPLIGHAKLFFCDITLGYLCEGHANRGTNYEYKLWC